MSLRVKDRASAALFSGSLYQFRKYRAADAPAAPVFENRHAADMPIGQQPACADWLSLRGFTYDMGA